MFMQQIEKKDYKHLVLKRGGAFIQSNEISFHKPHSQLGLFHQDRTSWSSAFSLLVVLGCVTCGPLQADKGCARSFPSLQVTEGEFSPLGVRTLFSFIFFNFCTKTILTTFSSDVTRTVGSLGGR